MGWLDSGSDAEGGHWWNRGPVHALQTNHPLIANGLKYGGLPGAAAGGIVEGLGRLGEWIGSRNQGDLAGMANNQPMPDVPQNWDVNLGDPQSSGVRMGPPAQGTLSQFQDNSGGAPAWYEDTTMNADDPMGLVPDYGQDGPPDSRGLFSPSARRDAPNGWGPNSGISSMQVGGQNVIIGQDPNQMYVRRLVDFG